MILSVAGRAVIYRTRHIGDPRQWKAHDECQAARHRLLRGSETGAIESGHGSSLVVPPEILRKERLDMKKPQPRASASKTFPRIFSINRGEAASVPESASTRSMVRAWMAYMR